MKNPPPPPRRPTLPQLFPGEVVRNAAPSLEQIAIELLQHAGNFPCVTTKRAFLEAAQLLITESIDGCRAQIAERESRHGE